MERDQKQNDYYQDGDLSKTPASRLRVYGRKLRRPNFLEELARKRLLRRPEVYGYDDWWYIVYQEP